MIVYRHRYYGTTFLGAAILPTFSHFTAFSAFSLLFEQVPFFLNFPSFFSSVLPRFIFPFGVIWEIMSHGILLENMLFATYL